MTTQTMEDYYREMRFDESLRAEADALSRCNSKTTDINIVHYNRILPTNEIRFCGPGGDPENTLAVIGTDGIFRVKVDPTDEAAKQFIEIVNLCCGVELTGMVTP